MKKLYTFLSFSAIFVVINPKNSFSKNFKGNVMKNFVSISLIVILVLFASSSYGQVSTKENDAKKKTEKRIERKNQDVDKTSVIQRDPGIKNFDSRLIPLDQNPSSNPIFINPPVMGPNALITIGAGTTTSSQYPFNRYYNYSTEEMIYLKSEINTLGNITTLGFNKSSGSNLTAITSVTIYMKLTASTTLASGTYSLTGYTQVYSGSFPNSATSGWMTVTLTTPFAYDNVNNLQILILKGNQTYITTYPYYYNTATTTRQRFGYSDTGQPTSLTAAANLPNCQMNVISSSTPTLSVAPTSLSFGYTASGGTSSNMTYSLSGTNLTGFPGNITVTAPSNFEVSLNGTTWASSVLVPYSSATLSATTIYAHFTPTSPNTAYSGNITNAGGGATTVNVAVTGSSYLYSRYCTSNATSTADEEILNVTLGSINNTSTCATTGGIGSILNEYSNFTTTVSPTNLEQGSINPFSVQVGTCGGNYGNGIAIWIDFNQNGTFEAGEEVYYSPAATTGAHTETGNITVPGGATLGNTMMRVVCVETGTPNTITACGTYSWGETEDYLVNIVVPSGILPPTSLSASAFSSSQINLTFAPNGSSNNVVIVWNNTGSFTTPSGAPPSVGSPFAGGTLFYNGITSPQSHTSLTSATSYYYKAWSYDGSIYSTSGLTANATTPCGTISSFPYNYDFGSPLNNCWNIAQVAGTGNWVMATTMSNPTLSPQSGTYMAFFDSYNFLTGTQSRLKTPTFDFTSLNPPSVEFYMTQDAGYPSNADKVDVQVSTNGGTSWTTLSPAFMRYNSSYSTPGWLKMTANLSVYAGMNNVTIGFLASSLYGNALSIDNVTIKQGLADDVGPLAIMNPTKIPSSQNLPWYGKVKNFATNTENFDVDTKVRENGTPVATTTNTVTSLTSGSTSLLSGNFDISSYGPSSFFDIFFQTKLAVDQNTANDTLTNYTKACLKDTVYAWDDGVTEGTVGFNTGSGWLGQIYVFNSQDTLSSITVKWGTIPGALTGNSLEIYNVSGGIPTNKFADIVTGISLSAADANTIKTYLPVVPIVLPAGTYWIGGHQSVALSGTYLLADDATGFNTTTFFSGFCFYSVDGSSWVDYTASALYMFNYVRPNFANIPVPVSIDVGTLSIGQSGSAYYPNGTTNLPMTGVVRNYGADPQTFVVTRTISGTSYISQRTVFNLAGSTSSPVTFDDYTGFASGTTYIIKDSTYLIGDVNNLNDTLTSSYTPKIAKIFCIYYSDVTGKDNLITNMSSAGYTSDKYDVINFTEYTGSFSAWSTVWVLFANGGGWSDDQRTNFKNFLDNSTIANKKTLILFGNDLGYLYGTNVGVNKDFYNLYMRANYNADDWRTVFTTSGGMIKGYGAYWSDMVPTSVNTDPYPDDVLPINGGTAAFIANQATDGTHACAVYFGDNTTNYNIFYGTNCYQYFAMAKTASDVFGKIDYWITSGGGTLPVEYSVFNSSINGRDVKLNWTTVNEINNSGFDIERKSINGNWNFVGFVKGSGTINKTVNYSFVDRKLNSGKYYYRLKQKDINGNFNYHDLNGILEIGIPTKYNLSQNYPNPFNPVTKIDYDLPFDSRVKIVVYDMLGREVKVMINSEIKQAGYYTADLNASYMASGIYFYRMIANGNGKDNVFTKKMVVVK